MLPPKEFKSEQSKVKKATYRIPKMSAKAKKENAKYLKLRLEYLATHTLCKASLIDCLGQAKEIHHMKKRGVNLNNIDTWLPVCRNCHIKIEEMPIDEAIEKGLRIKNV